MTKNPHMTENLQRISKQKRQESSKRHQETSNVHQAWERQCDIQGRRTRGEWMLLKSTAVLMTRVKSSGVNSFRKEGVSRALIWVNSRQHVLESDLKNYLHHITHYIQQYHKRDIKNKNVYKWFTGVPFTFKCIVYFTTS